MSSRRVIELQEAIPIGCVCLPNSPESEYRDAASSSVLQTGGSVAGGSGHSSLCLGLVVVMLWPGVEARLDWDPEMCTGSLRGVDWNEKETR